MYKVLVCFTDDKDKNHVYRVGDTYPRADYKPDQDRITYLAGSSNKFKRPAIEKTAAAVPAIPAIQPANKGKE